MSNTPMSNEQIPLEDMTLRQLRRVASSVGVSRYSRMRKEQLLVAIVEIQTKQGIAVPVEQAQALEQPEPAPNMLSNPAPSIPSSPVVSLDRPALGMSSPEAAAIVHPTAVMTEQETVEASKYDVFGQPTLVMEELASVDEGLPDLPAGYGDSRIMLLPRDPQWAYVYWDVPNEHRNQMRQMGGQQLALRLYDVTDLDVTHQAPHNLLEYPCDELAREWYMPVPVSDRDYVIEIGYRTFDGRWLMLARSPQVRIPPVYPSEWIEDQFLTIDWEADLVGKTFAILEPPSKRAAAASVKALHNQVFDLAEDADALRVAGSLYGSMQHVAGSVPPGSAQMVVGQTIESLSSYVFPSGIGMWAEAPTVAAPGPQGMVPNMSGLNMSGLNMSELNMSALNMSGLNMSGVGMDMFSASAVPARPRKFWLVADAELIVYGATEPDAKVYIGGKQIELSPDGTFRFQMSFQDGHIDYPILAVAADGEQTRAIHMEFNRQTPERRTNTKAEAVEEWL